MNVIFFAEKDDQAGVRLTKTIEKVVPADWLETYLTFDGFSGRLNQPLYDRSQIIAVILAANRDVLQELVLVGESLEGLRIILVLPDRDEETITLGLSIYPRFVSYIDNDFEALGSVLDKMMCYPGPGIKKSINPMNHLTVANLSFTIKG